MTTMTDPIIRPFRAGIPEEAIGDLRRRIAAARWPRKELVADRSQGVQLATLQALARYWEEPQLFSEEVRAAFRPLR